MNMATAYKKTVLQKKYQLIYHSPKNFKILLAIQEELNLSMFRKVQKLFYQHLNKNLHR